MLGNVAQLFGVRLGAAYRVDTASGHNALVGNEPAVAIVRKQRDAAAGLNPQRLQARRKILDALPQLAVGQGRVRGVVAINHGGAIAIALRCQGPDFGEGLNLGIVSQTRNGSVISLGQRFNGRGGKLAHGRSFPQRPLRSILPQLALTLAP